MTCPQEPVPAGWKVWQGPVPDELVQLAIDVRDHINDYAYGTIAQTVSYNGQVVGVFKSHHVWTYKKGVLVTGICIPGASLLIQQAPGAVTATAPQDLSTPDPSLAMYGADLPPETTNWGLVLLTGGIAGALVWAFLEAIKRAAR